MSEVAAAVLLVLAVTSAGAGSSPVPARQARDAVRRGDAAALLDLVRDRYRTLESLAVTGESVMRMTMLGRKTVQTTRYVARAARSGTFLVRWDGPLMTIDGAPAPGPGARAVAGGAVWNDGTGAFNYTAMPPGWAKASSDDTAIAMATGVSGAATQALFLFRTTGVASPLGSIETPVFEAPEAVDGSVCWVVAGTSATAARIVVWISRSQLLVRRIRQSLAPPQGREPTEIEGSPDDAIRELGLEPTPQARERVKMMMEMAKVMQKHAGALEGDMTQTYRIDAVDRPLAATDVAFEVPAGTPFKSSLLEGLFDAPSAPHE